MTDNFDAWINNMEEDEYIDRLESSRDNGGFSDAQKRIALNIREAPDETELRDLEREQESGVQQVEGRQPTKIYDTREQPERPRYVITPSGDSIVTVDAEKSRSEFRQQVRQQQVSGYQQSQEMKKRSILQRLKDFFRRKR